MSDKCQEIVYCPMHRILYFCTKKDMRMKYLMLLFILWCLLLSGRAQSVKKVEMDSLKNVALNEITVKGQRQLVSFKNGILTANVHHSNLASVGTGRDVLQHLPGVRYSEDGYQVFGRGEPTIYIDGHRAHDKSEIERLSSRNIEKVEIITNPGAEYEATVKAVIRIYTIRHLEDFMSASLKNNYVQGHCANLNEQLDLGYRHHGLSLFGDIYFNRSKGSHRQDTQYNIASTDNLQINSSSKFYQRGLMSGGNVGMNFDFSPHHSAGVCYQVNDLPSFHFDSHSDYVVWRNDSKQDQVKYLSLSTKGGVGHLINAFYQGEVNKWKFDFTTDIVIDRDNADQHSDETNALNVISRVTSNTKAYNNMYAAKFVVSRSIGRRGMKWGTDYTFIRRRDLFDNPQAVLPTTNSLIHESKIAGFTEWSWRIGKLGAIIGLRYEHAVSNYWDAGVYVPGQSRKYDDWLPNVSLTLPISAIQASLSYIVKKERPSFFSLRSSMNYNNRYIYEGGNSLLKPSTLHLLDFQLVYHWVQLSVGYYYTKNAILFQAKSYDKDPDVAIFTVDNFNSYRELNASLYLRPVFKWWKPVWGIEVSKPFLTVRNENKNKTMNSPNIYFDLANTFELPGKTFVSLDGHYQSSGNIADSYIRPDGSIDFGIRKTMLKDCLDINVQLTDVFASSRTNVRLYGEKLSYSKHKIPDSRQLIITLTYRFHNNKSAYKGKHVSETDMNRLR